MKKVKDVDEYLKDFSGNTLKRLKELRQIIKRSAPEADEVISYGMPSSKYNGRLVYYAGYKNHIGFYPMGSPIIKFKKELTKYKTSKGTVQFPIDKPLPTLLITKIVKFRVKENLEKVKSKIKK